MAVTAVVILDRWALGTRTRSSWRTDIQTYASFREQRNIRSDVRRWQIVGDSSAVSLEEANEILALFNQQRGAGYACLVKDPVNYEGTDEPLGTGDGADTTFQVIKRFAYGGGSPYDHPINHFVSGTLVVELNGTPTVAYTRSGGLITFNSAPGNGVAITASFEFYYPCRFENDDLEVVWLGGEPGSASVAGLHLVEVFGEE